MLFKALFILAFNFIFIPNSGYLNNWVSLLLAFLPPFVAFAYRIKIEEQALVEQFREEYLEYRKETKKLIPFIY